MPIAMSLYPEKSKYIWNVKAIMPIQAPPVDSADMSDFRNWSAISENWFARITFLPSPIRKRNTPSLISFAVAWRESISAATLP